MNAWIGKSLGKVQIDALLARGGMAEVYLGTHTTLKRKVAVKILRAQYEDDPDLLERFEREAQVVAKLRHQNIVQVFDFDSINDSPYIVMEYVPGPSLSQFLSALHKKNLRVELSDNNKILTGVANALQYAHNNGVIHRDIKPGNIILTSHARQITPGETLPRDFEPILTDFGLVRFLNASRYTSAGQTAGTPAYMSPEQARGETTDGRTDIYSLGIVLYEMLAGTVPFDGETTVSILLKHVSEPPPPIPGLSIPLQKVLNKALAKKTSERYSTPLEFANAFNAATQAQAEQNTFPEIMSVSEPVSVSDADPGQSLIIINSAPKSLMKRKQWQLIGLGISLLAATIFGGTYLFNNFKPPTVTELPADTQTVVPTNTELPAIPLTGAQLSRTAVLHFRDGDAIMDQAILEALALPAPPPDSDYEVWLGNAEERLSLGILLLDNTGKGTHTYNASNGENLFANYDRVEITIKPDSTNSSETEHVAYSYVMPSDGLIYIRQLLVTDPETPNRTALIQALAADTRLIEKSVSEMQTAYANSDPFNARTNAESIINLVAGSQSPDHKDWNGDGQISDLGEGFGFLLNGSNLGHVQAVFAHADYVANSTGASQNMIARGSEVKVCAENLAVWIPQLKELAQKIITATSFADMDMPVKDAVSLAEKISSGIDLNGNAKIDPLTGECGMATTYESAYAMADMPLLPVNLPGTPTATAKLGTPSPSSSVNVATSTKGSGGSSSNTSVAQPTSPPPINTPKPVPPGQQNKTEEPKPTKDNNEKP